MAGKKRRRRKNKLSKTGKLRRAISSLLDVVESENKNLRYLADSVLKHFVQSEKAFEDFIKDSSGNRARAMLEAVKTLYTRNDPFGKKIIDRLESIRFHQKLEARNRRIKEQSKNAPDEVMSALTMLSQMKPYPSQIVKRKLSMG